MPPRKYQMTRRAAAVEQTRARIIAATVAAHRDLGIRATSWDEIARRAHVGVGTVYRHFPTLDHLLPACGQVVTQTLALPSPDDAPALFADVTGPRARIMLLVTTVLGAYERGAPYIDNIRRERHHLPQLEHYHQHIDQVLDALVTQALRPLTPSQHTRATARALIDLPTWHAFTGQGFTAEQTTKTIARLIECTLRPHPALARAGRHRAI